MFVNKKIVNSDTKKRFICEKFVNMNKKYTKIDCT